MRDRSKPTPYEEFAGPPLAGNMEHESFKQREENKRIQREWKWRSTDETYQPIPKPLHYTPPEGGEVRASLRVLEEHWHKCAKAEDAAGNYGVASVYRMHAELVKRCRIGQFDEACLDRVITVRDAKHQ